MFVVYLGLASDLFRVGLWFVYLLLKVYLRLVYGFFRGGLRLT